MAGNLNEAFVTTSFATMASIRFGYGRRPGEAPPDSVDALMAQVERGGREACLFPHEGIAGRRARFPAYRALQLAYNEARDKNSLMMVGERSINPYSIAMANAFQRDRHLKVRQAVFSKNGFFSGSPPSGAIIFRSTRARAARCGCWRHCTRPKRCGRTLPDAFPTW